MTAQTGAHTRWEKFVANFCNLPHLSPVKAFGFTNVVSPGFEVHFIVVGKLRLYVPTQVPLEKDVLQYFM